MGKDKSRKDERYLTLRIDASRRLVRGVFTPRNVSRVGEGFSVFADVVDTLEDCIDVLVSAPPDLPSLDNGFVVTVYLEVRARLDHRADDADKELKPESFGPFDIPFV